MRYRILFPLLISIALLLAACQSTPATPTAARTSPTSSPTLPPAGTFNPTGLARITRTPTAQPSATPAPAIPALDLDDLDGLRLQFWYVWEDPTNEDIYTQLAEDFTDANQHGITVEAVNLLDYGALDGAMREAISAGGLPEMAAAFPYQYLGWRAQGDVLLDLTAYVRDPVFGLDEDFFTDLYPVFRDKDVIENQRLAFPAPQPTTVMFYNRSWGQELGFASPPATTEVFRQQACAAAAANNDLTGGWLINASPASAFGWTSAFGAEIEDGEDYQFNSAEIQSTFIFLNELKTKRCAWRPSANFPTARFAARDGLFYTALLGAAASIQTAFDLAENPDEWVPLPFPAFDGGQILPIDGPSYVIIKATPEEQLAAWLFLNYLLQPESQARLVQASAALPISRGVVALIDPETVPTQWFAAVELLEYAQAVPHRASWGYVQLALADAANELFRDSFTLDDLLDLTAELQTTAEELEIEFGD